MYSIQNHTKITIRDKATGEDIIALDTKKGKMGECVAGMPYIDVIDDSLDSFTFVLKDYSRRKPFKPFSFVTYEVNDEESVDTTTLFVLFDNVQSYSRIGKTYQHTVTCVESAKILEKTKIFNLNLTNLNDTLSKQFGKACINAEPVHSAGGMGVSSRYSVSDNLNMFLTNKPSHDFYFSNTDFRSVLDAMLAPYNARATVENVEYAGENITKIAIGYIPMDIVKDVAPEWTEDQQGEILAEELENDGQNYAGKIVARGYNSVLREPITFSDTFKSANDVITDKTATIFFPFPISDRGITSFLLNINARYSKVIPGTQGSTDTRSVKVSINVSSCFIPQEQYDVLDETTRKKYIPYVIGSTRINVGQTYSNWLGFEKSSFCEVLKDLIPSCPISGCEDYIKEDILSFHNLPFTCTYYPIIDTVADIVKPGVYDKDDILMGIMDSQTEQTLDIERHGKKLHGLIKRTGNTEYVVDVKAKCFSRLLPIMSRIDLPKEKDDKDDKDDDEEKGYVLYKREYAVYDNFIKCRYHFSKNCNAIQTNAGVNRERHIYDIPLEADEAPILIKKYLMFSFYENTDQNDGAFGNSLSYAALNTLIGENISKSYDINGVRKDAKAKLKYLLFQSAGESNGAITYPQNTENSSGGTPYTDEDYRFMLPLGSYALGKCLYFVARPLDNYSVGFARDGYKFSIWGDGGNKITYNRYVAKDTNCIGECLYFNLSYAFEFMHESESTGEEKIKKFPIVKSSDFVKANKTEIRYLYRKDRTQTPLFVLAVESIPVKNDYGNIIIGSHFAKNNNLVRDNGKGLTNLYLYISFQNTFTGDEDFIPSQYFEKASSMSTWMKYTVNHAFIVELTDYGAVLKYNDDFMKEANYGINSWVIADENGNIYLACNGPLQSVYASISDFPI